MRNILGPIHDADGDRAGWGLTFVAPQSVAQHALQQGDEAVMQAHRAAVNWALSYMESHLDRHVIAPSDGKAVVLGERESAAKHLTTHVFFEPGAWATEATKIQEMIGAKYLGGLTEALEARGYQLHDDGRLESTAGHEYEYGAEV